MNPRYRIIISVIVIILIVVLAYAFWPADTQAPSLNPPLTETSAPVVETPEATSTSPAESALVTYSDRGFSPEIVEIAVGGTVTFKNEATRDLWVASNDHPAHLLYPEFDAKKGYAPGSEYRFTFEKAGTWKYHDHLKASLGGTIIVK